MVKKYITPKEVSKIYTIRVTTLRKWRSDKRGLSYIQVGHDHGRQGTILYPADLVEEYFNQKLINLN